MGTANRGIFLAFLPLGSSEFYTETHVFKVKKNTLNIELKLQRKVGVLKTINYFQFLENRLGWNNLAAMVYKFDC